MKLKLRPLIAAACILAVPGPAFAAPAGTTGSSNTNNNCWGVVSAQLAQVEGGIGEHSSSQTTPRLGLGNVARLFYDLGFIQSPTVSALGSFLASLDEYDETVCPAE